MSGQIYAKIPKIMQDVGFIEKARKNPQQGYAFRGIDDVYLALQAPLASHGVFFAPKVTAQTREERQTKSGTNMIYTVLTVEFSFFAEDGSSFSVTTVGEAMDSGDKSANKAMSAALKYALLQLFCIPTEEDNDTENNSYEVLPKAQQTAKAAPSATVAKPASSGSGAFCDVCETELVLSKSGAGYYCPNFKDGSGNHTRFKASELDDFKSSQANFEGDVP